MIASRSRIRLVAALAAALLVGAACAEDEAPGDAAAGTGATGAAVTGPATGAGPTASTGSTTGGGGGGGRYDYGGGGGDGGGGEDGHGGDAEIAVTADNFAFSPTQLEVKSGSEIAVENANAGTPHTFTVDGTSIDVVLDPGDVEDATIDLDPGTYPFHCRFHASMTGTLTVT
jgi:plastocyanin